MQPNKPMVVGRPTATQASSGPEVLHYLGYDEDYGGIAAVVRALATTGHFQCVLGLNAGAVQRQVPPLALMEFPRVAAETPGAVEIFRAWSVARMSRRWLRARGGRIFHAHSRAGLLVALWLRAMGEPRFVVSVHTFGRHKAFYRFAAARLDGKVYWLSPAMQRYYGIGPATWNECLPDCIPETAIAAPRRSASPNITCAVVGPFARYKRMDILIRALGNLSVEERRRVRVIQAGAVEITAKNRAYAAELRGQAKSLDVAELIEWRGVIRPMAALWPEVDCLVVPSPIEAFSVAALEALASGVPVVASDQSGTSDLVRACRGGFLYAGADPRSLAQSIRELLTTDALKTWQPDTTALATFFAPAVAARYAAVYSALTSPAPRRD